MSCSNADWLACNGETDADQIMLPSWAHLAQRYTEREPDASPTLDDVETELVRIAV
jgi:hypothetical protein